MKNNTLENYGPNKVGINNDKATKNLFELLAEECFELVQDNSHNDLYPYDFKSAYEELEYISRDGFHANPSNKGGFRIRVFTTAYDLYCSGCMPTSQEARDQIKKMYESSYSAAKEYLKLEGKTVLTEEEADKLDEKTREHCSEDTVMYEVAVMYGGKERGVHSATVQVVINWEAPYHRSSSAGTGYSFKTEAFQETEITWKTNRSFRIQVLKAVKAGIKKLY